MFFFLAGAQVGIMIAFLLALVLEDVEKPYGGWRWVIAAQRIGRVNDGMGRIEVGEFRVQKNKKNGSRFKHGVPDGHFMSFSSPRYRPMCF